jgi:trimeric autotransporter adhesin
MSDENNFQLIGFNASLLGAYYGAKQQSNSLLTLPSVRSNVSLSNAQDAQTPWSKDNIEASKDLSSSSSALYRSLTSNFKKVQTQNNFIDRQDNTVRNSKLNNDSKGLFILYNALKDLKTIAEYAGDPRTSDNQMNAYNKLFQLGFSQVKNFIQTEKFEHLKLLQDEKTSSVTSKLGLGRKQYDYIGPQIHTGKVTDPIASLSGTETFTVKITKRINLSGTTTERIENFNINVADINGSPTLEGLLAQINTKIQSIKTTDKDGKEIPLFNTRIFAEETSKDKFALRIKTDFTEELTFASPDTESALYVVGDSWKINSTTKQIISDNPQTSFLTKLTNLSEIDVKREFHKNIFANESDTLLLPDKKVSTANVDPLANAAKTSTNAIAVDSKGYVYMVGSTDGRFGNHINTSKSGDAFLTKYDATGKQLWSRLIGSVEQANSYALTIDANDNIIVAGQAAELSGNVPSGQTTSGDNLFTGKDSFVVKYDSVGTEKWIYINDKYGTDAALAVTTDNDGNVYVTGKQNSLEISPSIPTGNDAAYVLKLNATTGTKSDYVEIGSSQSDIGKAIAVAADGNIVVATQENGHFILQKLNKDDLSDELWSYDFGDMGSGSSIDKIVTDGNRIYVAGSSNNSLTGGGTAINGPLGNLDGFVLALDDLGGSATADWSKFIGSDKIDSVEGITVDNGKIYLSGTTAGSVNGGTTQGGTDTFAMKLDATTGATDWSKQLGLASENRIATGVGFATLGSSVLTKLGLPIGGFEDDEKRDIQTQSTVRAGDYFYVKVNKFITKKIEIKEGDTFRTLANRINRVSFRYIKATVSFSSGTSKSTDKEEAKSFDLKAIMDEKLKEIRDKRNGITETESFKKAERDISGNTLKIQGIDGGEIEIIAGRGERDALKKLGLTPTKILSNEELFDLGKDKENQKFTPGGVFAFKLDDRFAMTSKRDARFIAKELENSIAIVQSAFRSLTFDPVADKIKKDALRKTGGHVPPHLLKQLNNYKDGLRRISTLLPQGSGVIT